MAYVAAANKAGNDEEHRNWLLAKAKTVEANAEASHLESRRELTAASQAFEIQKQEVHTLQAHYETVRGRNAEILSEANQHFRRMMEELTEARSEAGQDGPPVAT